METELYENLYASNSSDEFSTDDDDSDCSGTKRRWSTDIGATPQPTDNGGNGSQGVKNIVLKLFNRERNGCLDSGSATNQCAYNKVPNRLGFCLKDIVPHCFLQGHMFMGLSQCGQFLLSYKVSCNDNIRMNHYSLNIGYSYIYELYFWVYEPHKPLRRFYKCCLFDDHGVDNLKEVTMTQWKCADSRVLIVHGAAEADDENEDSYITYVKVPKLGCLDCKKLRDQDDEGIFRWYALCLKCNLTIHTKYSSTESDRKFNPYINLICPERILITANGFVHMLHIELDQPPTTSSSPHTAAGLISHTPSATPIANIKATPPHEAERRAQHLSVLTPPSTATAAVVEEDLGCDNRNNIVARIIADFSDIEADSSHSSPSNRHHSSDGQQRLTLNNEGPTAIVVGANNVPSLARKTTTYDELIFTCNGSSPSGTNSVATSSCSQIGLLPAGSDGNTAKGGCSTKVSLVSHTGKRHHRIVTKSFRNGVTTVDLHGSSASTSSSATSTATAAAAADKSNAYDFTEDNEKCEKISTLRKRRLAEKKYEFSEDNSENIIPFTKIRSAGKTLASALFSGASSTQTARAMHRPPNASGHHFLGSPCASPSSSPHPSYASPNSCDSRHCTPPPMHRASPITLQQQQQVQLEFRSPPCNSPVSTAIMRSPSRHNTQLYGQKSPPTPMPPLSLATQQMLSFKPLSTLSPLQVSMTKRNHLELNGGGAMSPNTNVPFLSPRREEFRVVEIPLQADLMAEKPVCTKKFKRRYVEEDDAASVITSEEDDCISPGYHTSLPMEVHGSCYSEMQMVSQATYQQLRCASVIVTQHSFDLETFTYYVISTLCQKNHKTYDVFYDWACELISVCPLSHTIICLLMAQFSAREQLPTTPTNCLNCSKKLDCAFHRHQFECRILFTWNMETGEWEVLDYGELLPCKVTDLISPMKRMGTSATPPLADRAKKLAHEMSNCLRRNNNQCNASNLRVLDSNLKKSKMSISDHDNMIEFYLKRPRTSDE